jgi:hypothetical protein
MLGMLSLGDAPCDLGGFIVIVEPTNPQQIRPYQALLQFSPVTAIVWQVKRQPLVGALAMTPVLASVTHT